MCMASFLARIEKRIAVNVLHIMYDFERKMKLKRNVNRAVPDY